MQQQHNAQNKEFSFYSYEFADEKNKHIIAKGLPLLDCSEIKSYLQNNHHLNCLSVYILAKKDLIENTKPVYLVTFDKSVDIKDVRAINFILNVKVQWEKYKNSKRVTQCHRCQAYGHGSKNCYTIERCMYCAANHSSKDCTQKEADLICVNCKGKHKSNASDCPIYLKRLKVIDKNRQKRVDSSNFRSKPQPPPPRLEDFPRPAWTSRVTESSPPVTWVSRERGQHAREDYDSFQEIASVASRIHQLCDVNKILQKLLKLESLLKQCTNEHEQLNAFLTVMRNG